MPEEQRLRSLRDLVVLDSEPEPLFDSITRLASQVCGTSIALLSLIDDQRQWFKANVGLPGVNETPRDIAFCSHAIHSADLFMVPDASLDPRFSSNPLVTGAPDIRFYAGAPIELPDGERVGTLCVIDRQARTLNTDQSEMLEALAEIAGRALTMRRDLILKTIGTRTDYERRMAVSEARHRTLVDGQSELVSLAEHDGTLVYIGPAYASHFGLTPVLMAGTNLLDYVASADRAMVRTVLDGVLATGVPSGSENRMISAQGVERWVAWTNSVQAEPSGRLLLRSVGRDVTERRRVEAELRVSQSLLTRTGRLAGVGGWELDLPSGSLSWSEQTRRIHEVDDDYVPLVANAIGFYAPEARGVIEAAVKACMEHGTPWDLELPMVTAKGRAIWARALGEAELENGIVRRLTGAFADITQRKLLELRLADSERFIRQVTDNLPVGIAYVDAGLRFRFVNQEHCRRFGKGRDEILGQTREQLTGRRYPPLTAANVDAALDGEALRFEAEEPVGGSVRLMEHHLIPDRNEHGRVQGLFGVSSDITERTAAEKKLRDLTDTLGAVIEAIPAMVAVVGSDGLVAMVNLAYERWTGVSRERAVGLPLAAALCPAQGTDGSDWINRALNGETASYARTAEMFGKSRHIAGTYSPLRAGANEGAGFILVAQDDTATKLEGARLLQLAQRDPLTGLLNRAGFEAAAEALMADVDHGRLALLCVDLDHFKPVNDSYGHPAGDAVLREFARRVSGLVRPTDVVARLGGDEFAILLPGVVAESSARMVASKVVAAAAAPFLLGALQITIGASVGVALRADDDGWDTLFERADAMLYQAKGAGRGTHATE